MIFGPKNSALKTLVDVQIENSADFAANGEADELPDLPEPDSTPVPRHRVNWILLGATVLLLAIGWPAVRFWHERQIRVIAGSLLKQAELAEEWRKKADYLGRYVDLFPNNFEQLERFAHLLDDNAETEYDQKRTLAAFRRCAELKPDRHDLRVRHGELLLVQGFPIKALHEADSVLIDDESNLAAIKLRAGVFDALLFGGHSWQMANALAAYETWHEADPSNIKVAARLANLHHDNLTGVPEEDEARIERANEVINRLVANHPNDVEARLARFAYRRKYQSDRWRPGLDPDVGLALEIEPENARALLSAATCFLPPDLLDFRELSRNHLQTAQRFLEAAINTGQADVSTFQTSAQVSFDLDYEDEAERTVEEGIEQNPSSTSLRIMLAKLQMQLGRWNAAQQTLDELASIVKRESENTSNPWSDSYLKMTTLHAQALQARWYLSSENPAADHNAAVKIVDQFDVKGIRWARSRTLWSDVVGSLAMVDRWKTASEVFAKGANNPGHPLTPRLYVAEAFRRAGEDDEAIQHLEILLLRDPVPDLEQKALYLLSHLLLKREAEKPVKVRRWRDFERTFDRLKEVEPESKESLFIEVEYLLARHGLPATQQVIEMIQRAENKYREDTDFWEQAVVFYGRLDAADQQLHALDVLQTLDSTRAARYPTRLAAAGRSLDSSADPEHADTQDGSAELVRSVNEAWEAANYDQAFELLWDWSRQAPDQLQARVILMDLAVKLRRLDDIQRLEEEFAELEGPNGSVWKYTRVRRLILQAELGEPGTLLEAAQLSKNWVTEQPDSKLARTTAAIVVEAQGDLRDAIRHYEFIYHHKDRSVQTSQTLAGLSLLEGNHKLARDHLDELPESDLLSPRLLPLAVTLRIQMGEVDEAIALAERVLKDASKNTQLTSTARARLHATYGRALLAKEDSEHFRCAEDAFLRAVELDAANFANWVALIYVRSIGPDGPHTRDIVSAMRRLIALAEAHVDQLPDAWIFLAVAQCLELKGDLLGAELYYRKAIHAEGHPAIRNWIPADVVITNGFLREASLELSDTLIWSLDQTVRQTLGLILCCTSPDARQYQDYLDDQPRLRAIVGLCHANPDTAALAIESLLEIPVDQRTRGDQLLLAETYRWIGQTSDSLNAYEAAAGLDPTVVELREMAAFAIRHQNWEFAQSSIDEIASNLSVNDTVDLQLELLISQGEISDALQLATDRAQQAEQPESLDLLRISVETFVSLDELDAAIALADKSEELSGRKLVFMELLGKNPTELEQTIENCVQTAEEAQLDQAAVLAVTCAQQHPLSAQATEQVEQLIRQRLVQLPVDAQFYALLARLRESQGRLDEAMKWTKAALTDSPEHPVHLNNLAWYEATHLRNDQRPIEIMNQLIRHVGPRDFALDTKAVALLTSERPAEAVRLLETIASPVQSSVESLLHLALAYQKEGREAAKQRLLKRAQNQSAKQLMPFDRELLKRLSATSNVK